MQKQHTLPQAQLIRTEPNRTQTKRRLSHLFKCHLPNEGCQGNHNRYSAAAAVTYNSAAAHTRARAAGEGPLLRVQVFGLKEGDNQRKREVCYDLNLFIEVFDAGIEFPLPDFVQVLDE